MDCLPKLTCWLGEDPSKTINESSENLYKIYISKKGSQKHSKRRERATRMGAKTTKRFKKGSHNHVVEATCAAENVYFARLDLFLPPSWSLWAQSYYHWSVFASMLVALRHPFQSTLFQYRHPSHTASANLRGAHRKPE